MNAYPAKEWREICFEATKWRRDETFLFLLLIFPLLLLLFLLHLLLPI